MSIIEVMFKLERARMPASRTLGAGSKWVSIRYFLSFDDPQFLFWLSSFKPRLESPSVPVTKIRSPDLAPWRVNRRPVFVHRL